MNLQALQTLATQFRDERNWKKFHAPKNLAISLSCEAAEVLEHFLWKSDEESENISPEKKQELAYELGDVLLNVLLLSDKIGIDIEKAFLEKLEKTKQKYPTENPIF